MKIYSALSSGYVYEREAVSESAFKYTLRNGSVISKDTAGDRWRKTVKDALFERVRAEEEKLEKMRSVLGSQEVRVAMLRQKLEECQEA